MNSSSSSRFYGLLLFLIFEIVVFAGLKWLLSDMGMDNQFQPENTIVPNWVKAALFILLYLLSVLTAVVLVSNYVPSKHRKQLMGWVYLALLVMLPMLFFIFE
ncbi:hypothetical protein [Pontibacter harenae]|uniref:hypothetical protein n=1 Tax=Pontibacter harenae TaxID=2894083 RepID=UPI001E5C6523|nr:hypothetical protein [Pontibacter harenae]MCC9165451.1 hypothetical protein [Pontibacter harenae]